jgi:hypothetical protein
MAQGRQTDWLAERLRISRNYLYRMRLNATNPMYRQPQPDLWARCERILGVPGGAIGREDKPKPDPALIEARRQLQQAEAQVTQRRGRRPKFEPPLKQAVAAGA